MSAARPHPEGVVKLLDRLRAARERAGVDADDLAKELILGPGWIQRFESGRTPPDLDTLFVLIEKLDIDPVWLFANDNEDEEDDPSPSEMDRLLKGEQAGDDLIVHFVYSQYDAQYRLKNATVEQLEEVLTVLRDGLARLVDTNTNGDVQQQIKTNAVVNAFLKATELWEDANPSDIWWFVLYRAYCDPYNHPAEYARTEFPQSWKRTGGWVLEEIVVRHYRDELKKHGITIEIATGQRKVDLAEMFNVDTSLEPDKIDVFLIGPDGKPFGVVHVKASFAERRTDDVPMSSTLIRGGYFSPMWTMDCKSTPGKNPHNRGELGKAVGKRSAKRKDIEDAGLFSACYSYNKNTKPTPSEGEFTARIILCDFSDPDDAFSRDVVRAWEKRSKLQGE